MEMFLMIGGFALVVIAISFVLYNHWQEFHGDNHY